MAYPINDIEKKYVSNNNFGLRVGSTDTDAVCGAAYALNDVDFSEEYSWDYHLNNTLIHIIGLIQENQEKHLLFISPAIATGERYKVPGDMGIYDKMTFSKVNSITKDTKIHMGIPISGTSVVALLIEWVYNCINEFGPMGV